MKNVPFFANTADNTHCVQASFKIMLKYFLPKRDFSWEELDKLSHKTAGKGTWWFPMLLEIEKMGLKTKYIEHFDYQRYLKEGNAYVLAIYGPEAGKWYLEKSNLTEVKGLIPEFLKQSVGQRRAAELSDIDDLLAKGWLVGIDLNSRTLNKRPGFSSHMIVIYEKAGQNYLFHDPGLPPKPRRKVPPGLLLKAWQYAGSENVALIAVGR
jgi:hypothetical protein